MWLHQSNKGLRDRHGNPLPNAHLVGMFRRICKLLFYHVKPVFVFDGGAPMLKRQALVSVFWFSVVFAAFYPRDAMLARVIVIATCLSVRLSVRPSVRHAPVLCQNEES